MVYLIKIAIKNHINSLIENSAGSFLNQRFLNQIYLAFQIQLYPKLAIKNSNKKKENVCNETKHFDKILKCFPFFIALSLVISLSFKTFRTSNVKLFKMAFQFSKRYFILKKNEIKDKICLRILMMIYSNKLTINYNNSIKEDK